MYPDRVHFDVNFELWPGMVSPSDELLISDGEQSLKITESNSKQYKNLRPNISFKGSSLVVVYYSPLRTSPITEQFISFLEIYTEVAGGIVDTYDRYFKLPQGMFPYSYTLKVPKNAENAVLEFNELTNANVEIYNRQNEGIVLKNTRTLSITMPFSKIDGDIFVQISKKCYTKMSGSVVYRQGNDCGGTLFASNKTISIRGSNQTCHWFLGAQASVINVTLNDLRNGSLEIYSVEREAPIFTRNNIGLTEKLLPIVSDTPAYMKIKLGPAQSSFDATISPLEKSP
jgi:hypothetical protein